MVAQCRQLTCLSLQCVVKDEDELEAMDFDALGSMKALKHLVLQDFPCNEGVMEAIVDALPRLEHVALREAGGKRLHHCHIVEHIARLKNLSQLDLFSTQMTAKSLRRLSFRTGLKTMSLNDMVLNKVLMHEIGAIKALEFLDLSDCKMEKGLANMKMLTQLPNVKQVILPCGQLSVSKSVFTKQMLEKIPDRFC